MEVYTLHAEQFVPRSLDDVFTYFSRPENLAEITPPSVGFVILTPSPIRMQSGTLINYTIKLLFMRVRWTSLITSYDPPYGFVDEQLHGPYAFWHHTHTFKRMDGGTSIIDNVRYSIPFSIIGQIAHSVFVRRQLEKIFCYRAHKIKEIFGEDKSSLSESRKILFGEAKL